MFHGMHGRGCGHKAGHHAGPRGSGRWERGPFSVSWEFEGGERHGRGRGGGRRRMFDGGELKLVILKLIADEPRHGYDVIRSIEELTGGAYAPSPGVVYPTITLLDDMGQIEEQRAEGAKKLFAVTETGKAHLEENKEQVEALMARLTDVGADRQRTDRSTIRRAMGNLRNVLQNRLVIEEMDENTLHDIAALIDDVAQKIERLK